MDFLMRNTWFCLKAVWNFSAKCCLICARNSYIPLYVWAMLAMTTVVKLNRGAPWALKMVCIVTMVPGLLLAHASSLSARQLCSTVRIPGVSPKIILVCNIVLKKGVLAQNQYLTAHLCVQNPSGHVWCSGIDTLRLHYESKGASSFMFLRYLWG